jgi:hypothetical protein
MAYTLDQIRAYGDNLLAGGGSIQDVMAAAQQFGVPLEELAGAYGMDRDQGLATLSSAGVNAEDYGYSDLTSGQIDQARDWVNQQWGGQRGENGVWQNDPNRWQFNGDFSVGNNRAMGRSLIGAADSMGYSNTDVAQILGTYSPDQVAAFGNSMDPRVRQMYGDVFQQDAASGMYDPANTYTTQITPNTPAPGSQTNTPGPVGGGGGFGGMPPGMGGWSPGGVSSGSLGGGSNPYLGQMADAITGRFNNNLSRNILPGIRSEYRAMGGQGGSRQGIAEGLAIGESNRGLADALSGAYFGDWTNQQNRNLQRYGMDQNYNLGMGQLALGNQGQMLNFYGQQRGQDLQQIGLGAQLYGLGQQGPWGGLGQASNIYGNIGGQNTNVNLGGQGGGWQGALGGALAGGQLGRNFGWW